MSVWGRRVDAWVASPRGTSAVRQVAMLGLVIFLTVVVVAILNAMNAT